MANQGSKGLRPPKDTGEQERIGRADNPGGRREWFLASRIGQDEKLVDRLYLRGSRQRHKLTPRDLLESAPPPAPPGGAGTINWTPIGPSVVAHGQASNNPPVSGRITSIVVGPGGTRAYAGAANGGVLFTPDSAPSSSPLDANAASPRLPSC